MKVLLMLAAFGVVQTTAPGANRPKTVILHVAPDGKDSWTGRLARPNKARSDGPLASLRGARDAIRRLKKGGQLAAPVRVIFAPGTYFMTEPVVFTPEDSGTQACPITYEASAPGKVVFEGGREIRGFRKTDGPVWTAHVPELAAGKWYFEQLWVNGRRAVRARTPNVVRLGETCVPRYLYIQRAPAYARDPKTGEKVNVANRAFYVRSEDMQVWQALPKDQLSDVTVIVYQAWESTALRPAEFDEQTGRVMTTGPAPWAFLWLGPNQRYHLENFRAALDEPGEWFLDRDGMLYYWPLPDEDLTKARVVAPVASEFLRFEGDTRAGLPVEHISLRGLAFHYAGYDLPPEGHGDGQAAVGVPGVIMADGARHITIEGCQVAHIGTYGIWFRRGCSHCTVRRCEVHDMGAGGLRIGEPLLRTDPADQTHHITFDNNIIRAGGRFFTGAVGVWIGQASDNSVTHNDISDLFYTGISVGWSWGYLDTTCKRNTIAYNHIHHLGWGVMSDMGGIYTLGISDGTVLRRNVIHDIYSYNRYGYGGLGIYNDEGSTHITVEENLVYDTLDMTYHQHYGRENVIRNNILVNGRNFQISVARPEPHLSITFERNIVYWTTGKLFWAPELGGRKVAFDYNLYFQAAGAPFDFMGLSLEQWQALGQDVHSLVADPQFYDVERRDLRLRPTSPAFKLGFRPFDYSEAGVYGDRAWVEKARALKYAPVEFAPEPPPVPPVTTIEDDFEMYPPGVPPLNAQVNVENKGDAIVVTDETAATGTQSLKLVDAEGLQYSFNPHLVYTPNFSEGVARVSFDVRLKEGAELWHECRDWSQAQYTTGPSLQFIGGRLKSHQRELMEIPMGQWFHVEIEVPLGEKAGKWTLTVSLPGQEPRRFSDLDVTTPGWDKLTWVGFVSNAITQTVIYLDNVSIRRAGAIGAARSRAFAPGASAPWVAVGHRLRESCS